MDPPNMDMELFEALLANMHQTLPQGGGGAYDDDVDDDDDDYEDDDDDDDDDDYDYGGGHEHNIHAMANPYGGGGGGEGGDLSLPTMQTMSILQGLLNMNPAALPGGVPDMGGAMSGPMNGGMGSPMEAGGGFLSNMPSFLPAMNTEMAGSLAGAFAGGIGALMDGFANGAGGAGGANISEYHDDDLLSDEEDEEDDEDDDEDDDDLDERGGMGSAVAVAAGAAAVGAVGGMMASRLMGSGAPHPAHMQHPDHPAGVPHPVHAQHPAHGSHPGPLGFTHPQYSTDMLSPPTAHPQLPPPSHHSNMAPSMSGGSVRSVDPLAGVPLGLAGVAAGASLLAPVVNGLLNNKPAAKLDNSDASSVTLVGDDSLNSTKTLPSTDRPADPNNTAAAATAAAAPAVAAAAAALEKTHISQPNKEDPKSAPAEAKQEGNKPEATKPATTKPAATPKKEESEKKQESVEGVTDVTEAREETPKPTRVPSPKEDQEDDKASVGADSVPGSEEAVDGKSDTESVRKKTPSPVLVEKLGRLSPTGSESTPVLESASCASITDLASATESMRDSDTDNHSDAHNVTANLSDLDNDLHEAQPKVRAPPQYAVGGHLPIVIEKPTFGWQSMVGLDTAKDALKNLFMSETFPEVFEGTQGTCKGVLLFGPVGSGKTCLARALAKEAQDAILIGISTAYLATQPPSEAPKIVRYLFDHARMHSPAVILFDEVDALCYDRSSETAMKAKIELLHQIRALTTLNPAYPPGINPHAFNDGIMVLGTTNQPWLLEDDLRRIFTYNIHVKLPAEKAREELYRMFLQTLPHTLTDDHFKCLVAKSEGYNAADINMVVRQVVAQRSPTEPNKYIQNVSRPITYDDLATVMTEYRCRFTDDVANKYQSYIKSATHRSEERREDTKNEEKAKPKGVKKFGQRIAKSIAAALVAVID
ncbi:uncharacterized AAA domain-containing protein C328.04-like isoform X2 [Portunus trituberculatus]|uniref:uncharacterized AAA domain-containing protein C328.04-like isoform X2 n=1 Tax=Portunus trituberculatus TaxID=210409 RepID=UPI001E1D0B2C|nr:uncharacterized AAA domain-containing protein C328.04-like isoform X2 [Portunus trituberculatus]